MNEEPMVVEVNCTTGEVIRRPFTEEEIKANKKVADELAARDEARKLEEEAKAIAKASAEAKLAALGLTAEEIAAL